jgi:hypothetical protein
MLFEYVPMEDDNDNDIETVNFAENFNFSSNDNTTSRNIKTNNNTLRGGRELRENLLSLQNDGKNKYNVVDLVQTEDEATV